MLVGAIIVIGNNSDRGHWADDSWRRITPPGMLAGSPIVCLDLLGQSVLDRTVQKLQQDGVSLVTVVVRDELSHQVRTSAAQGARLNLVPPQTDLWSATECALRQYVQHGVELVLLTRLKAYMEVDLCPLIRFHRDTKQGVTLLSKDNDPLDSWVIDAGAVRKMSRMGLPLLVEQEHTPATRPYPLQGYVSRLEDASDLRRLVVDAFLSRCSLLPKGHEVSPGVWFDVGVRTHRRARIVAPAYLGRGVKLHADTLVTRFSALERGCDIHDGTVVEDASILANTYVGKGLNVAHAVVDGNHLFPLRQNVLVEIQDNKLLGRTQAFDPPRSPAGSASSASLAERLLATAWN